MISHFLRGLDGISTKDGFQLFLMVLNGYAETPPDSYKAITWLRIQILEYLLCTGQVELLLEVNLVYEKSSIIALNSRDDMESP
mgnify:CR=1 FL=1